MKVGLYKLPCFISLFCLAGVVVLSVKTIKPHIEVIIIIIYISGTNELYLKKIAYLLMKKCTYVCINIYAYSNNNNN